MSSPDLLNNPLNPDAGRTPDSQPPVLQFPKTQISRSDDPVPKRQSTPFRGPLITCWGKTHCAGAVNSREGAKHVCLCCLRESRERSNFLPSRKARSGPASQSLRSCLHIVSLIVRGPDSAVGPFSHISLVFSLHAFSPLFVVPRLRSRQYLGIVR